ncbi:hypothetical protein HanIR_Chr05g0233341 [Helianthus annuus]|nr:hypothetical protein HanIR_Chr05g0233341 [Helianthus annuus]
MNNSGATFTNNADTACTQHKEVCFCPVHTCYCTKSRSFWKQKGQSELKTGRTLRILIVLSIGIQLYVNFLDTMWRRGNHGMLKQMRRSRNEKLPAAMMLLPAGFQWWRQKVIDGGFSVSYDGI